MELSIIIVNYNTFKLTKKCIESVYQYTEGIDFEIILVDNASIECNADLFNTSFPAIQLIKSPVNVGFAKGNNLGIAHAQGNYILLLNSDIELTENSIQICLNKLKSDKNIGVVSPMLIYPNGKIQFVANKFPSLSYELIELFRLNKFLLPKDFLLGYYFDQKENKEVDWVWGAFFLTTREVIDRFSNQELPSKYFMYFEDVAWCHAVKKMGYSIQYIASTKAIHHVSASSNSISTDIINFKKLEKIIINETDFWIIEKGKVYTILLFFLRALKYFSLRTRKDLKIAKIYFNNIPQILNYTRL